MYNLIIVDDNRVMREGLKKILPWSDYQICITGTFDNGQTALDFIHQNKVDILLADVEMPIMNGLELVKAVLEQKINTKCILISCHDNFEYVKTAINLGIVSYILKPIIKTDLEEVVLKSIRLLEQETNQLMEKEAMETLINESKPILKEHFLQSLFLNTLDTIPHHTFDFIKDKPAHYCTACIKQNDTDDSSDKYSSMQLYCICKIREFLEQYQSDALTIETALISKEYIAVLFIFYADMDIQNTITTICTELSELINTLDTVNISIGVSNVSSDLKMVGTLYAQAESAITTAFTLKYDNLVFYGDVENTAQNPDVSSIDILKLQKQLEYILVSRKLEEVDELLQTYILHNKENSIIFIRFFISTVNNLLDTILVSGYGMDKTSDIHTLIWQPFGDIHTYNKLQQHFYAMFTELFRLLNQIPVKKDNTLVNQIKEIVNEEYKKKLTTTYLAKQLNLANSYINNIFKRETGQTIPDYITEVKMEKAKKLLQNEPNIKIAALANTVGYTNLSHFNMLFKRYTGLSPLQYRTFQKSQETDISAKE